MKNFFGRTTRKLAIVVVNLNCTEILVLQWQRYNFSNIWKCKNFSFSLYTVLAEMLYLQKFLTNFQKLSFGWKTRKVAIVVENSIAQIFWFCNGNGTTLPTSKKCKNFNFSLYTVTAEMLYLQKYLAKSQKRFFGW